MFIEEEILTNPFTYMQDQELINKVITVSGKEEKLAAGKPVMKIKDEKNLSYSVWKFKKDGTESVAWGQIPDIGETTQIGYVEETKDHPEHGATTYRTIRTFNKDIGNGVANNKAQFPDLNKAKAISQQAQQPGGEFHVKDDKFWDMKAYKQCLWNFWLDSRTQGTWQEDEIPLTIIEKDRVWNVFKDIEKDANKRFFQFEVKVAFGDDIVGVTTTDLPTIQVAEEWDKTYNCTVCGTQGATHGDGHDCINF